MDGLGEQTTCMCTNIHICAHTKTTKQQKKKKAQSFISFNALETIWRSSEAFYQQIEGKLCLMVAIEMQRLLSCFHAHIDSSLLLP